MTLSFVQSATLVVPLPHYNNLLLACMTHMFNVTVKFEPGTVGDFTTVLHRYNIRKLALLRGHVQHGSSHQSDLDTEVLYSFDWIIHKILALGYQELLDDYASIRRQSPSTSQGGCGGGILGVQSQGGSTDIWLVEQALRQSRPFVFETTCATAVGTDGAGPPVLRMDLLAVELVGRLVSYSDVRPNVRRLLDDCRRRCPGLTPILPHWPYRLPAGCPLLQVSG